MADIEHILKRIAGKDSDYASYSFTPQQNNALKMFFDLSQEIDELGDFYRLCVAIPRAVFDIHARMFVLGAQGRRLEEVASTGPAESVCSSGVRISSAPYAAEPDSLILPIRGNAKLMDQLQYEAAGGVLGMIEICQAGGLGDHSALFFEKYANRIGYNLHNRYIVQKNIEHIRFIRNLVTDIEHNIITPNMVYKLYLRNLKGKVLKSQQVAMMLSESLLMDAPPRREDIERVLGELGEVNQGLASELGHIEQHYKNMSLFLETLLRRGHFDHGRLMLRTKKCNIKRDVLTPQIEHYRDRFANLGIEISDRTSGVPEEDSISVVDVGLIAQVYSNLFSNALKYTQAIVDEYGMTRKYVSYGRELAPSYFGPGKDGIKYNVFSTGPHVNPSETGAIFDEGYRGADTMDRPGTGHGLAFIRNVLEMHGGIAGYEATRHGNNFFFILPA